MILDVVRPEGWSNEVVVGGRKERSIANVVVDHGLGVFQKRRGRVK